MNNRATKAKYTNGAPVAADNRSSGEPDYVINIPPPQESAEALWPERFLPFLLLRLTNGVTRTTAPVIDRRFGLSMREWRVILLTAATPGITAIEVAEQLSSDKMIVSRAVNDLKRKGMLQRKSDPADRRRSHLYLTSSGWKKYRQVVSLARAYDHALRAALSRDEVRSLERMLLKLNRRVGAIRFI